MLPQIIVGLRHLLDVEYLRPTLVAHALSRLQLRLDADDLNNAPLRLLKRLTGVILCKRSVECMSFADAIIKLRSEIRISQKELAEDLNPRSHKVS